MSLVLTSDCSCYAQLSHLFTVLLHITSHSCLFLACLLNLVVLCKCIFALSGKTSLLFLRVTGTIFLHICKAL